MAFNRNYLSWTALNETIRTDIVTVGIYGNGYARERFRYFSSPHPRFPLIPRKSLGAAMIDLRGNYADYRLSKLGRLAKRKLNSAKRLKYSYSKIDAVPAIDHVCRVCYRRAKPHSQ